jgi:hypothetical protein
MIKPVWKRVEIASFDVKKNQARDDKRDPKAVSTSLYERIDDV